MTTRQSLLNKFDGDEEAISDYYREIGKKSRNHPNRQKGNDRQGFAALKKEDPIKLKELSSKGGKKSKRGKSFDKERAV